MWITLFIGMQRICYNRYMKKIKLTQNKFALVDDSDFEKVNQFKWYANKQRGIYYALRKGLEGKIYKMHQQIMGNYPENKPLIDHIDRDGLNNQRNNLRFATYQENGMNRKIGINNKSGFKGVSWNKRQKKWQVITKLNGKSINLGEFKEINDAAQAYNNFIAKNHGEFARKS